MEMVKNQNQPIVGHLLGGGGTCATSHRAPLLRRIYPEWVHFYPLTKCPLRRANPWVQDLCKRPSVLPYPVPPR